MDGSGGFAPIGVQGQSPLSEGLEGEAPLKLKSFTQLLLQLLVEIRVYF